MQQDSKARKAALQAQQQQDNEKRHQNLMKQAQEERMRHKALSQDHHQQFASSVARPGTSQNVMDRAFVPVVRYPALDASVYRGSYVSDAVIGSLWNAEALFDDDSRQSLVLHCIDVGKVLDSSSGTPYTTPGNVLKTLNFKVPGPKRIKSIETEIERVQTCPHPNILRIFAAQTVSDTSSNTSRFEVALAPYKTTLESITAALGPPTGEKLYDLLLDVAHGLEALHSHHLSHKCVHARSVALQDSEETISSSKKRSTWVLTGSAYQQSLVDLNRTLPFTTQHIPFPNIPPVWQAPEVIKEPLVYTPGGRDMWDFGVLVAWLLSSGRPYSWVDPAHFTNSGLSEFQKMNSSADGLLMCSQ